MRVPRSVILVLLFTPALAYAVPVGLPSPHATSDGIPVATSYGDFHSYSGGLLNQWGQLPDTYYTGADRDAMDLALGGNAGATDNLGKGPDGTYDFEDPVLFDVDATGTFEGRWGDGTQDHGPVHVDDLADYLETTGAGTTIPSFVLEYQSDGHDGNVFLQGSAYIWDPDTETQVAAWSFNNGPDAPVVIPGTIQVTGASGTTYIVDNTAEGQLDFILRNSELDLADFTGEGYWFVNDFALGGLTSGSAQWRLSGLFGESTAVHEPAFLAPAGLLILLVVSLRHARRSGRSGL